MNKERRSLSMEDKHPVQALVWGVIDLVVAVFGFLFIIPEIVLPIVYTGLKSRRTNASGSTANHGDGFLHHRLGLWHRRLYLRHSIAHHWLSDEKPLPHPL